MVWSDLNSCNAFFSSGDKFGGGNLELLKTWVILLLANSTADWFRTFLKPFSTEATMSKTGICFGVMAKFRPFSKTFCWLEDSCLVLLRFLTQRDFCEAELFDLASIGSRSFPNLAWWLDFAFNFTPSWIWLLYCDRTSQCSFKRTALSFLVIWSTVLPIFSCLWRCDFLLFLI